jgi:hypothetical protein
MEALQYWIVALRTALFVLLLAGGSPFAAKAQTTQPMPYSGTPIAVPGSLEAEHFDLGGEGLAYHDNFRGNSGGQYRVSEDVDIIVSTDSAGGGYVVNNFETGEWLAYTINVQTTARYDIEIRASTTFSTSAFHVEIDSVNLTGSVTVPNTGSWSTFQWAGVSGVPLTAGQHVLKIVADQQFFNLNSVRVTPVADTQAPSIPANLTVTGLSSSQVTLSWSAATDNVGVTGYRVYRNGTLVASPATTSVSITGLSASTQYSFTVSAVDAAGNASAQSAPLSVTTQAIFSTLDSYFGDAANWEPLTPSRWSVVADGGDPRYGINTSDFVDLPTARLGEYSLVKGRTYGDFAFAARVRSTEDFAANPSADYDVVFGWQDADNYYYAMFSRTAASTQLFKVAGGVRQPALATANFAIPNNNYHLVAVARNGSLITVSFDGATIMQASDATFGAGRIGIGGFNDAAWWDDILITGPL